jgi:catalase (peroxidase I)
MCLLVNLCFFLLSVCFGACLDGAEICSHGTCSNHVYELQALRQDLFSMLEEKHCNPILVRLAWHDSGTYDASVDKKHWPKCGGANGRLVNMYIGYRL